MDRRGGRRARARRRGRRGGVAAGAGGLRSAGRVAVAVLVEPDARGRLRSDVLGAEERERALRGRRRGACAGAVRAAHDAATRAAVGYLERSAAAVRRGHGGAVVEEASAAGRGGVPASDVAGRGSAAAHARPGREPRAAAPTGGGRRWTAGGCMRRRGRRASSTRRCCAASSRATLGVEWSPVRKGIAEVVGVRGGCCVGFSRRRAEIEAALAERGTSGARAAEAAALATRSPKSGTPSLDELVREWRARAAELGLGPG